MTVRPSNDVLFERIDAMSRDMDRRFESMTGQVTRVENSINGRLDRIEADLHGDYIMRSEFLPVQRLVYGFTGLILTGFVAMLVYLVWGSK